MQVAEPPPEAEPSYEQEPPDAGDSIDLPAGATPASPSEVWARLLAAAREKSSMLYVDLCQGRLQRIDATEAVLAFPSSRGNARKDIESQRDVVRGMLSGILKRPVTLRFVTIQDDSAAPKDTPAGAAPAVNDPVINKWSGKLGAQMVNG